MKKRAFPIGAIAGGSAVLAAALLLNSAAAATLQISFDGAISTGVIHLAVYAGDDSTGWRSEPVNMLRLEAAEPLTVKELQLDAGSYAIKAYIDTNSNNELDVNGMGYPREPVAYSVGSGRSEASRRFRHAVFLVEEGTEEQKGLTAITLNFVTPRSGKAQESAEP